MVGIFTPGCSKTDVFLGTEIDDEVANLLIAQLLFLDSEDPEKDVMLYINSPGGVVTAGLALYDTIQLLHCDVATYCMGEAASMGSFLLATGAKGKRFALPHARVMIHQANSFREVIGVPTHDVQRQERLADEYGRGEGDATDAGDRQAGDHGCRRTIPASGDAAEQSG